MTVPAHKFGFRWTLHLFAVVGFCLVLLIIGGVVALFVVEIEDVIYADGRIVSELPFDVISHVDGRVIRLHFEEGDDVREGDVIAEVDPMQYEEEYVSISRNMGEICVKRNFLEDPFFIAGVREYQTGDPMNRVHWLATARQGRIMVHQNESSSSQSRSIVLNMQTREFANSGAVVTELLEDAIRTCAALFEQTAGEGIPMRFFANAPKPIATEESWGEGCLHSLLETLARLPLDSGEHFPFYLNSLYDTLSSTDVILVTCYLDEATIRFARDKMDAGVPVRLYVLDPDAVPPESGDLDVYVVTRPRGGDAA